MSSTVRKMWLLPALAIAAVVACSSSTEPGIQPQVSNVTDNFQYQVSNVKNFTGTKVYTWQITGTQASVNQATTVTAGAITLVIKDAADAEVYNQSLAVNGTLDTAAGTTGAWTIRVQYTNATGTVNFRVQKKP
jgi:hypothetical protein